ncbi:MAG: hypothetical protein ACKVVT_07765 [Dehalococcoidia bacterium]
MASVASAAANNLPKSGAGDGSAAVLEYVITGPPVYTLNTNNPQQLDQVSFTLSPAPSPGAKIRAQVLNPGGTWYACTASGASITCGTTVGVAASALTANQLRVVVVD